MKIVSKEGKALIKISREIYPKEYVLTVVREFQDIADICIKNENDKINLEFVPKENIPLERIIYEFMNFLLARIKEDIKW